MIWRSSGPFPNLQACIMDCLQSVPLGRPTSALSGHLFQCFAVSKKLLSTAYPSSPWQVSAHSTEHRNHPFTAILTGLWHLSLHVNQPQLLQIPQRPFSSFLLLLWTVYMVHLFHHPKMRTRASAELHSFDIISRTYLILQMIHSQTFVFFKMV